MAGPLSLIQRLIPFLAKKDEVAMYNRLLKDVDLRGSALDRKIIQLNNSGVDPSSDRWVDLEQQRNPLGIAFDNLTTAAYAPGSDREARLLLSTDDAGKRHQASLVHRGVGYHAGERGIPDNGVYIEGLSSELAGGGTQLLKELEKQFGGLPMYLESVANPSTLNFYMKKGFVPQRDGSSDVIPRRLFIKPAHVQVKKRGGLVQMKEKRCG